MFWISTLTKPEFLSIKNRIQRGTGIDTLKVLFLSGLAILFFILIYFLFTKVLHYFHSIPVFGDFLTKKLLLILFLTFFFFLIFSNLITSLSTFFLSGEMNLIVASPVPLSQIYYSRLILSLIESSWMVLILALPILFAYGRVYSSGLTFYISSLITILPYLVISSVIGTFITILIVSVFPARKIRDFLVIISFIIFGGLYVLFRILQPEKLINPEIFKSIADYFTSLSIPDSFLLPSVWLGETIMYYLTGKGDGVFYFLLLTSTAGAFLVIGEFLNSKIFPAAWTKAQEARGARVARGAIFELLTSPVGRFIPKDMKAIIIKDIKTFFRDASQWTQIFLLIALIVVYLMNFRLIPFDKVPDISFFLKNLVSFLNLGLAGFVLSAMAVRFIYPSISLEGKNFWLLKSSPLTISKFVWSKFFTNIFAFLILGEILIVISNYLLKVVPFMVILGAVTIFFMVFGIVGLAVGIGAIFPRFHVDNPARIATGFGGFLYMITSLLFVGITVALEGYPTYIIFWAQLSHYSLKLSEILIVLLCFSSAFILNILAFYLPVKLGILYLEKREL
jgi:ABC-2 type transport system permease protein